MSTDDCKIIENKYIPKTLNTETKEIYDSKSDYFFFTNINLLQLCLVY